MEHMVPQTVQEDLHAACKTEAESERLRRQSTERQLAERLSRYRGQQNSVKELLVKMYHGSLTVREGVTEIADALDIELTEEREYSFTITGTFTVEVDLLDDPVEASDFESEFTLNHSDRSVSIQDWDASVEEN